MKKSNDKHDIRRKIEETRATIRERRKVRERLSREFAGTLVRIASIRSNIRRMMAQHKTTIAAEKEEFMFATVGDRKEIEQCEDKCAELERELASSDIVEREQAVASKRLADLRVEDEKEEMANAREMTSLKKTLFNAENDLENAFRTTLHNLNVFYQDQAFGIMVEEARKAREELPSLKQALHAKTRETTGVMAKHRTSVFGAMRAKAERDVVQELVMLQAQRTERLKRKLSAQRELVEREHSEFTERGEQLEAFQAGAGKLRTAAVELRRLQAESSRKRQECRNACMLAYRLVDKGPKAINAKRKRKRLAQLNAALFSSSSTARSSSTRNNEACPTDDAATRCLAADPDSSKMNRNGMMIVGGVQEKEKQAYGDHDKQRTMEEADERMWRASLSADIHRRQMNHHHHHNNTTINSSSSCRESCGHIRSTPAITPFIRSSQDGLLHNIITNNNINRRSSLPISPSSSNLQSALKEDGRGVDDVSVTAWYDEEGHHHTRANDCNGASLSAAGGGVLPDLPYGFTDLGRRVNVISESRLDLG